MMSAKEIFRETKRRVKEEVEKLEEEGISPRSADSMRSTPRRG